MRRRNTLGLILLVVGASTATAQDDATKAELKPRPIPAEAYRPAPRDNAYLARQRWAQADPVNNHVFSVLLTLPDRQTYEDAVAITRKGPPKGGGANPDADAMLDGGKVFLVPVNAKVLVLKTMPELAVKGGGFAYYPVEVKLLDGPARGSVVWTNFFNVSPAVDTDALPFLRQLEARATVVRKKALAERKSAAKRARNYRDQVAAKQAIEEEIKLGPYRAAMQTEAIRQQAQAMETQARMKGLQELNQLVRESRLAQLKASGAGIMYGPNGAILPGDPLPVSPGPGGRPYP